MKQINLDLGQTYEERYGAPAIERPDKDRPVYPSFTYEDDEEALDIPKKGKMLIEYEESSRSESKRDGKEHYECRIDVKRIISVEGEKKSEKAVKAADALDAIKEALESEQEGED
jgi:hypothetical protein